MEQKTAFEKFTPAIFQVYHRDKEAFWAAVMAPFLANQVSFLTWLQNIKVDVGLLSAFKGLDDQARKRKNPRGAKPVPIASIAPKTLAPKEPTLLPLLC